MKKKTLLLTLVFTLLVGGTVGAMIDVSLDKINNKAEEVKTKVDEARQEYKEEKRHMLLTSTAQIVDDQAFRLEDEVMQYYYDKQYRDLNKAMKQETQEVKELTDQKIAELKAYIDTLFKEDNAK